MELGSKKSVLQKIGFLTLTPSSDLLHWESEKANRLSNMEKFRVKQVYKCLSGYTQRKIYKAELERSK